MEEFLGQRAKDGVLTFSMTPAGPRIDSINGNSRDVFWRRLFPLSDNTLDAEFRCRSMDGFLGEGEVLEEVIQKDMDDAQALGTSVAQISEWMGAIVEEAERHCQHRNGSHCTLWFLPTSPPQCELCNDPLGTKREGNWVRLDVEERVFMSPQFSPFINYSDPEATLFHRPWNFEFHLTDALIPGLSLVVAGGKDSGSVEMARELGFLEGGKARNPYRLCPFAVVALLRSRITPISVDVLCERMASQSGISDQQKIVMEIEGLLASPSLSDRDREALPLQLAHFSAAVSRLQSTISSFRDLLVSRLSPS